MKKAEWKEQARTSGNLAAARLVQVRQLEERIRDLEANWQPIPIPHPFTPRDPACKFCDDPAGHPRHTEEKS